MDPSKIITRYPRGFLSFLGVQSQGEAPSLLNPTVQSICDVSQFLLTDRLVVAGGNTAAIAAIGYAPASPSVVGPPPGELWIITHMQTRPSAALGAGTNYSFQMALFTGGNVIPLGQARNCTPTEQFAATYDNQIIIQSGDSLGVWVSATTPAIPAVFGIQARVCVVNF